MPVNTSCLPTTYPAIHLPTYLYLLADPHRVPDGGAKVLFKLSFPVKIVGTLSARLFRDIIRLDKDMCRLVAIQILGWVMSDGN